MSCTCPGRLEVSRGIVEAKRVTSDRHKGSAVYLTSTNSCQLNSTHMTPTNCSRITSDVPPDTRFFWCVPKIADAEFLASEQSKFDSFDSQM